MIDLDDTSDDLAEAYRKACEAKTDIQAHVPRLRALAARCRHVTEFGVRYGTSTVGLLAGLAVGPGREYVGVDLKPTPKRKKLRELAESHGVTYTHLENCTLHVQPRKTDLIFFDTKHTFDQLSAELDRHAGFARSFLVFHDTVTFGDRGHGGGKGLLEAIANYRDAHPVWAFQKQFDDSHGLTILSKEPVDL